MRIMTSEENMKSRLFRSSVLIATFVLAADRMCALPGNRSGADQTGDASRSTGTESIRHSPASCGRSDQGGGRL